MFDVLFYAVFGFIIVGLICAIVTSVMQFAIMGSIFGLVINRMKQQIDSEAPKTCEFCGSNIPLRQQKCVSCGSSRDPAQSKGV